MNNLIERIRRFSETSILVVGDVMLDTYVKGTIDRISPEAPVPILKVVGEEQMLGGAGNVVRNVSTLGASCSFITVVGGDSNGRRVEHLLSQTGKVKSLALAVSSFTTVSKTRYVSGHQQLLRVDVEESFQMSSALEDEIIEKARQAIGACDVVILSDYKKGVLTKRVVQSLIKLASESNRPILVDPKGTDFSIYHGASLVKPNLKELLAVFGNKVTPEGEVAMAQKLVNDFNIKHILVTLGKDGALLVDKSAHWIFSALERRVFDVSGAGDTVIATLAVALGAGASFQEASQLANIAGGVVVTKPGTSTVTQNELENDIDAFKKHFTLTELLSRIQIWRANGKRIGFTNGCFDIIHKGHINTLTFAQNHCDKLIVGLNSDASVRRLKGPERPINNELDRATVLAQLACVDGVVIFDEDTPLELIQALKPDILVKGGDYEVSSIVGAKFVTDLGGSVLVAPMINGHSTTGILTKLKSQEGID